MSTRRKAHQRLVTAVVPADLHVFEGMGHFFFSDTGIPEARAAFARIADFFDRDLGR